MVNTFNVIGYIKTKLQVAYVNEYVYIAFLLENDKAILPIYCKEAVANYILNNVEVGTKIKIVGEFKTQISEDKNIKLYLYAKSCKILQAKPIQFSKNVVINAIIEDYDTEDLLKTFRKANKKRRINK